MKKCVVCDEEKEPQELRQIVVDGSYKYIGVCRGCMPKLLMAVLNAIRDP